MYFWSTCLNFMCRKRFIEIIKFLHFSDNEASSGSRNKMFKLQPLADLLIKKLQLVGVFDEELSIEESIIKYYGHQPAKRFITGKVVRFVSNSWMIASAD